jgi:hypothetical protein
MKITVVFVVVLALLSASLAECKCKKTVSEIVARGKVKWVADELERMINNNLDVEDIIAFTPKF